MEAKDIREIKYVLSGAGERRGEMILRFRE